MPFIYDILYFLAFIFYSPVLLIRGKFHGGYKERFSFFDTDLKYRLSQKPNIWIHAVSVGEVLAVAGLIEKIRENHPGHQVVLSTVTRTGYDLAKKRFSGACQVIYGPVDLGWVCRRFVKFVRPGIFILAETEIWPNLLAALNGRDIPVVMVNGRISGRSFYNYLRFKFIFQKVLRPVNRFCMQSVTDADRIMAMGALSKKVIVLGCMKFDDVASPEMALPGGVSFNPGAPIWVAGSTHPGEERIVFEAYKKLRIDFPKLILVMAPRHIERSGEVLDMFRQNEFQVRLFSKLKSDAAEIRDVLIVDTIGHLKALYSVASVVFVGKSLTGHGGQNIIEPAFYAKPVIVGPHMENFADIAEIFNTAKAIIQIQGPEELEAEVRKLLSSEILRLTIGERAAHTVKKNQGATLKTQQIITEILNTARFVRPV